MLNRMYTPILPLIPYRRASLAAAGAAGLCYSAVLAYPIYRYLAPPEEMPLGAKAVTKGDAEGCSEVARGAGADV